MTLFGVTSKKDKDYVPCEEIETLRGKLTPDVKVWGERSGNE